VEFTAEVDAHGRITVPASVLEQLGPRSSRSLFVRLTGKSVGEALRKRGVHEEEIEHIAALQREPRDQVVKFLLSEGVLKKWAACGGHFLPPRKGRKR
jgi:bifunctional DNA-binding transcriptional regulator/antitoxin component of YhaV-PrlF toxin-antitoxin module